VHRAAAFWLDAAVKAALVGLLAFGAFSGLQQFEGKAFGARLATYPLSVLVVPAAWWLLARAAPYPYAVDILLAVPFLIDVVGNAADLYDTIDWWDDANHFVNWAILTSALAQLLLRLRTGRWVVLGLTVGFGAVAAILWEVGEYYAFIRHSDELRTAYTDTLGDLSLGLAGSVLAGVVGLLLARRATARPSAAGAPA
jgi:hypothetical protein